MTDSPSTGKLSEGKSEDTSSNGDNNTAPEPKGDETPREETPREGSQEVLPRTPSGVRAFRLDPVWLIDYDELVIADRISESPTAKVFQGEYRGQEVAIKIFSSDMINVDRLQQEFTMIR